MSYNNPSFNPYTNNNDTNNNRPRGNIPPMSGSSGYQQQPSQAQQVPMYGDHSMQQQQQQSRSLNQSIHQQQQTSYSNQQQQQQNYTNLPKPMQHINTMGMTASSNSTNMVNTNMSNPNSSNMGIPNSSSNMSNTSNLKNEWDQFFAQSVVTVTPNIIDNQGSNIIQSNQIMYNNNNNNLPPVAQTNYNMKESLVKTIQESSGNGINNTNTMFMKQGQSVSGGGAYPNMSQQQQGNMSYNSSGVYNNTSQQKSTTRVNTASGGGGGGNVLSAQMLQSSNNNSNINMNTNNIPIAPMQGSTVDHRGIGERGFYNPNSSGNIGITGTGLNRSGGSNITAVGSGVMGGNILANDVRFRNRSINNNYQNNRDASDLYSSNTSMTAAAGAVSMRESINNNNTSGNYESNNTNYDIHSSHMLSGSSSNVYDLNSHSSVGMNSIAGSVNTATGAYQNISYMNNNTNNQLQQQHQQDSFQAQNQGVQYSAAQYQMKPGGGTMQQQVSGRPFNPAAAVSQQPQQQQQQLQRQQQQSQQQYNVGYTSHNPAALSGGVTSSFNNNNVTANSNASRGHILPGNSQYSTTNIAMKQSFTIPPLYNNNTPVVAVNQRNVSQQQQALSYNHSTMGAAGNTSSTSYDYMNKNMLPMSPQSQQQHYQPQQQQHQHHPSHQQQQQQQYMKPLMRVSHRWSAGLVDPLLLPQSQQSSVGGNISDAMISNKYPQRATVESGIVSTVSKYGPSFTSTSSSGGMNTSRLARRDRSRSNSPKTTTKRRSISPVSSSHRLEDDSTRRKYQRNDQSYIGISPKDKSDSSNPIPTRSSGNISGSSTMKATVIDYSKTPVSVLVSQINMPSIHHSVQELRTIELGMKFPELYIPADFLNVKLQNEWLSTVTDACIHYDNEGNMIEKTCSSILNVFANIHNTIPVYIENNATIQVPLGSTSSYNTPRVSLTQSDILAPPSYTCINATTVNNCIIPPTHSQTMNYMHNQRLIQSIKPVKFQVRVLICCGVKDPSRDAIDHNLPLKLRFLCGSRRGNLLLLGCPWSEELDGGNPYDDSEQSCLIRTVQRALFAQCLLRIPVQTTYQYNDMGLSTSSFSTCEGLAKLCQVNYHRPKEEIKGKLYPEQEEVTAIYLYTLSEDTLQHYLNVNHMMDQSIQQHLSSLTTTINNSDCNNNDDDDDDNSTNMIEHANHFVEQNEEASDVQVLQPDNTTTSIDTMIHDNSIIEEKKDITETTLTRSTTSSSYDMNWLLFSRRIQGIDVGPILNQSIHDFDHLILKTFETKPAVLILSDVTSGIVEEDNNVNKEEVEAEEPVEEIGSNTTNDPSTTTNDVIVDNSNVEDQSSMNMNMNMIVEEIDTTPTTPTTHGHIQVSHYPMTVAEAVVEQQKEEVFVIPTSTITSSDQLKSTTTIIESVAEGGVSKEGEEEEEEEEDITTTVTTEVFDEVVIVASSNSDVLEEICFEIDRTPTQNNESSNVVDANEMNQPTTTSTTVTGNVIKIAKKAAITSIAPTLRQVPMKPSVPTISMCPMPIPEEALVNPSLKSDALGLRLLPLQTLLSYSQDDRSERLFEVSLAAELVRSSLSTTYATIITDILLASHPLLYTLADARVCMIVSKLRAMIAADKARLALQQQQNKTQSVQPKPTTASTIATTTTVTTTATSNTTTTVIATPVVLELKEVTNSINSVPVLDNTTTEVVRVEESNTSATLLSPTLTVVLEEGEDGEMVDYSVSQDDVPVNPQSDASTTTVEPILSIDTNATATSIVDTNDVSDGIAEYEQQLQQQYLQIEAEKDSICIDIEEARLWRQRFVSSCRWFDTLQVRSLEYDNICMIIYVSKRFLNRADVEELAESVCKNSRLRYEAFI